MKSGVAKIGLWFVVCLVVMVNLLGNVVSVVDRR
jgi:hypothetical protein